jgi:hypothetical protein
MLLSEEELERLHERFPYLVSPAPNTGAARRISAQ